MAAVNRACPHRDVTRNHASAIPLSPLQIFISLSSRLLPRLLNTACTILVAFFAPRQKAGKIVRAPNSVPPSSFGFGLTQQ